MKKYIAAVAIVLLIGTNLFTLYFYNRERNRVKNAYIPSFSQDYFTRQLSLSAMAKDLEKKYGYDFIGESVEIRSAEAADREDANFLSDVSLVKQNPAYPNGCEAASATMILKYVGLDITLKEFIDDYLITKPVYDRDGKRYGPNPSEAFAGDPADAMYGWGTLEPAIERAIYEVMSTKQDNPYYTINNNGNKMSLDAFARKNRGPFVIWTTLDYSDVKEVYQWLSYDGTKTYTYPKDSHTIVITGMDEKYYFINDPLKDEKNIKVEKETLESSFDSAGRQAISIDINSVGEIILEG